MKFMGYRRMNGAVGVRNHVLIFPTVTCAASIAQMISQKVPNSLCVIHPHGCGHLGEEQAHMIRVMSGFCSNPNIAGVLLLGLGCELITPEVIIGNPAMSHQRTDSLNIQLEGGTTKTVEKGIKLALKLQKDASQAKREKFDINELIVGTHCGGSDTLSGLTANPALGIASDLLVEQGGTVILSETPEMLGTEHILARRAINDEVKEQILQIAHTAEERLKSTGTDIRGTEPSPGNITGGLTTLEEKSLGAVRKGGTSPINEVVGFACKPSQKGLIMMDGPAHDIVSNTGMIAAGAQIIAFTTGRGTPIGSPVAPVIKISSNNSVYQQMRENIDVNAGILLEGEGTLQSSGNTIFKEIVEVASGKLVQAELLGHHEFAIHSIEPTV